MVEIKDKHIAITGILIFYKRSEVFDQIICRGGIPQNTVTKETDYLVIGYYRDGVLSGEKSNKQVRAEKYMKEGKKIKVITGDEFVAALWNAPVLQDCTKPSK